MQIMLLKVLERPVNPFLINGLRDVNFYMFSWIAQGKALVK